jgi:broad specificity phosphatase PhoE
VSDAAARGAGPGEGPAPVRSGGAGGPAGRAHLLWLVRHGETEWSRARRHTGRTDLPLTRRGERQALALAPVLARLRPALVLCSPRLRARRTAELAGLTGTVVDADLAEWDYGEYEGLTIAQIRAGRPGWTIWDGDPPGGETAEAVVARADRVLDRVRAALGSGDVVTVGHGHFSRVLAARWLGLPPSAGGMFTLEPAAPCALGEEHGRPAVVRWNLADPLGDDADG